MSNLEKFKVGHVPSVYVIPDYLSEEEEAGIIQSIDYAPKVRWKMMSGRRLQQWGGVPHAKGLIGEPLPEWLVALGCKLQAEFDLWGANPNHVLINEYLPGQGIMPHEDGPLYNPCVAILCTGSSCVMNFRRKHSESAASGDGMQQEQSASALLMSVFLPRRALLVFRDDAYVKHLHGIEELMEDVLDDTVVNAGELRGQVIPRGTRRSLTIRRIEKVIQPKWLKR